MSTSSESTSVKEQSISLVQLRELANTYWHLEKFALCLDEPQAEQIEPLLARIGNFLEFNQIQIKSDYYDSEIDLPRILFRGELIQDLKR